MTAGRTTWLSVAVLVHAQRLTAPVNAPAPNPRRQILLLRAALAQHRHRMSIEGGLSIWHSLVMRFTVGPQGRHLSSRLAKQLPSVRSPGILARGRQERSPDVRVENQCM
jgi:hypothetical protein